MIKLRSGVFETNSSSTHTCVLMAKDNYKKWEDGSLAYIFCRCIENLVEKYSKKEYLIDEDFVDIEAFKDIPAKALFTISEWKKRGYIELADKYTLYDLWQEYLKIPYEDFNYYYAGEFDEDDVFPYDVNPEIRKVINKLAGDDENHTNLYEWSEVFKEDIGIASINNVFNGNLERSFIEKTINGQKIVVICEYGYDG